jgi:CHAD domain-containing protein
MGAILLWTRLSVHIIKSCSLTSPPMKNADTQSYQLLTTRYLRKQARQLSGQMVGLRESNDIEFVHRARVACRRLRAVMQMSRGCVPRKQFKVWRKEIRKLLKGLGDARDKDVQSDFLWRFLADLGDPALLPGIARIVVGLETQREQLQPTVVAAAERAENSGVIKDLLTTSKATLEELSKKSVQLTGRELFTRLEKHISGNLDEFLDHQDCLDDPQNEEGHHEMRIAAKQFRYTLEICKPAYAGRMDDPLATVKRIQTLLGDIHDCDVWIEHLAATLGEEGKRLSEYYGHNGQLNRLAAGIEHLRAERRATRVHLFEELLGYWQELKQEAYWDSLRELVGCCALRGNVPPSEEAESVSKGSDDEKGVSEEDDETRVGEGGEALDERQVPPTVEATAGEWT